MTWATRLRVVAAVFAVNAAYMSSCCHIAFVHAHFINAAAAGSLAFLSLMVILVTLDMLKMNPANSHTIKTLLQQYIILRLISFLSGFSYRSFLETSRNCKKAQDDLLSSILRENKDTVHGQKQRFCDIKTRKDYIKSQPLTTYKDYEKYMDDISAGKQNILTADKVVYLPTTSGTTGKNKTFPYCSKYRSLSRKSILPYVYKFVKQFGISLRRQTFFALRAPPKYTSGGIQVGAGATYMNAPLPFNLMPASYLRIYKETPSIYVQALFALSEEDLESVVGGHSNMCHTFFQVMERHWQQICNDVQQGRIDPTLDIPHDVRKDLHSYLTPNPKRADQLRAAFDAGIEGLAKRIWPHLSHFIMVNTGSFFHCANILQNSFLKNVAVLSPGYAASEGMVAVNCENDLTVSRYYFTFQVSFFEFIPAEDYYDAEPRTYFLDQIEKGREYEVVLTTTNGLYRYRLGDVIKVVDFLNTCPIFEFMYRFHTWTPDVHFLVLDQSTALQVLNLMMERTPEPIMYEAVMNCQQQWPGVTIDNYTVTESFILEQLPGYCTQGNRKHYVMFIEAHKESGETLLTGEENLQVKTGTFAELKSRLTGGLPNIQFKMPRVLRREELLSFLLDSDLNQINP